MFGIEAPSIWMAYLLCILSALLCVIYGIFSWNKGAEEPRPEDRVWVRDEEKVEQEL